MRAHPEFELDDERWSAILKFSAACALAVFAFYLITNPTGYMTIVMGGAIGAVVLWKSGRFTRIHTNYLIVPLVLTLLMTSLATLNENASESMRSPRIRRSALAQPV